ncbi:MAG: hypothetical protein H7839_15445, partial [Magnetococcus sp. YQC-5]
MDKTAPLLQKEQEELDRMTVLLQTDETDLKAVEQERVVTAEDAFLDTDGTLSDQIFSQEFTQAERFSRVEPLPGNEMDPLESEVSLVSGRLTQSIEAGHAKNVTVENTPTVGSDPSGIVTHEGIITPPDDAAASKEGIQTSADGLGWEGAIPSRNFANTLASSGAPPTGRQGETPSPSVEPLPESDISAPSEAGGSEKTSDTPDPSGDLPGTSGQAPPEKNIDDTTGSSVTDPSKRGGEPPGTSETLPSGNKSDTPGPSDETQPESKVEMPGASAESSSGSKTPAPTSGDPPPSSAEILSGRNSEIPGSSGDVPSGRGGEPPGSPGDASSGRGGESPGENRGDEAPDVRDEEVPASSGDVASGRDGETPGDNRDGKSLAGGEETPGSSRDASTAKDLPSRLSPGVSPSRPDATSPDEA